MTEKFDEKFASLINYNISRTFMQNPYAGSSDIPVGYPTLEADKLPKPPAGGFIATYCCEDSK